MTLYVIAYDIPQERRRARLHRLLLATGNPVQESLFECDLDDAHARRLLADIRRLVRPGDKVRIYPLCTDCAHRVIDGNGNVRPLEPIVWTP